MFTFTLLRMLECGGSPIHWRDCEASFWATQLSDLLDEAFVSSHEATIVGLEYVKRIASMASADLETVSILVIRGKTDAAAEQDHRPLSITEMLGCSKQKSPASP